MKIQILKGRSSRSKVVHTHLPSQLYTGERMLMMIQVIINHWLRWWFRWGELLSKRQDGTRAVMALRLTNNPPPPVKMIIHIHRLYKRKLVSYHGGAWFKLWQWLMFCQEYYIVTWVLLRSITLRGESIWRPPLFCQTHFSRYLFMMTRAAGS